MRNFSYKLSFYNFARTTSALLFLTLLSWSTNFCTTTPLFTKSAYRVEMGPIGVCEVRPDCSVNSVV